MCTCVYVYVCLHMCMCMCLHVCMRYCYTHGVYICVYFTGRCLCMWSGIARDLVGNDHQTVRAAASELEPLAVVGVVERQIPRHVGVQNLAQPDGRGG